MKIHKLVKEIREAVGERVIHEWVEDFRYYTSGDYITVENLETKEEVATHNIFTNPKIKIEFVLKNGYPSQKQIEAWLKKALKVAKKHFKNDKARKLRAIKKGLLQELKGVEKEIKGLKKK